LDENLRELGAQALLPLQLGDENSPESDFGSLVADFNMWKRRLLKLLLSNDIPSSINELISSTRDTEKYLVQKLIFKWENN
jgi:hypothetical protein